ncbi:MAG: glycosyltransferase family 39 protein [Blastochloris sp.]|nr:glycosyltransferase family 39 protein [Blastochloris sp.]
MDRAQLRSPWLRLHYHPARILSPPSRLLVPALIDRDEPRFAQATVEMMDSGSWVIPTFNGAYRFDKPPLTYWLMRGGYALFGISELGARLHSIVFAVGTALLLLAMGREFLSLKAGFYAALAWLTCLQVSIHGRLSLADMPMIFFVCLAQWMILRLLSRKEFKPWSSSYWILYASLTLGFLAKGPIAWVVPLITVLLWWLFSGRQPLALRRLQLPSGLLLCLLGLSLWGLPALLQTQGAYWDSGMGDHVIKRGATALNGRIPLPFYYFISCWISLFPWCGLLIPLTPLLRKTKDPVLLFALAWCLAPVLIFTFYATQLPHYILPGFPGFFLLVGWFLAQKLESVWLSRLALGLFSLVTLAALFLLTKPMGLLLAGVLLALLCLLAGMCLVALAFPHRLSLRLPAGLALIVIGGFLLGSSFRPLSPIVALKPVFEKINPASPVKPLSMKFHEPGLVFYSGQAWDLVADDAFLRERGPQEQAPLFLLPALEIRTDQLLRDSLPAVPEPTLFDDYQHRRVVGVNFARASWVVLDAYWRDWEEPAAGLRAAEPNNKP